MFEVAQAQVLVLLAAQGRLAGDRLSLPGGDAEVTEDDDGDQLVQVTSGAVRPDELVRAVLRAPGFSPRGGPIDLVVVTDTGWDRHLVSEDLRTSLLHARRDDRRVADGGLHVVVVGRPAGEPTVGPTPSDATRAVVRLVDASSVSTGQVTELPLTVDPVLGAGARRQALTDADLVVASWGVVDVDHDDAIDDVRSSLRAARDRGVGVLVRTRAGQLDAVGADGHPAARDDVRADDGLATAPAAWLHGAPLG